MQWNWVVWRWTVTSYTSLYSIELKVWSKYTISWCTSHMQLERVPSNLMRTAPYFAVLFPVYEELRIRKPFSWKQPENGPNLILINLVTNLHNKRWLSKWQGPHYTKSGSTKRPNAQRESADIILSSHRRQFSKALLLLFRSWPHRSRIISSTYRASSRSQKVQSPTTLPKNDEWLSSLLRLQARKRSGDNFLPWSLHIAAALCVWVFIFRCATKFPDFYLQNKPL